MREKKTKIMINCINYAAQKTITVRTKNDLKLFSIYIPRLFLETLHEPTTHYFTAY